MLTAGYMAAACKFLELSDVPISNIEQMWYIKIQKYTVNSL